MASYYIDTADVTAFRPELTFASSDEPTAAQTTTQIEHYETIFEAVAKRAGYTVPVVEADSPRSWALIHEALVSIAAWWVLSNRGYTSEIGDQETISGLLSGEWQRFLAAVADVQGYLVDAAVVTGGPEIPVRKAMRSTWSGDSEAVDSRQFTRESRY